MRTLPWLLLCLPLTSYAAEPLSGFADGQAEPAQVSEPRNLLERQARSGAAPRSEVSAQIYVDSQKRLAESFRRPIPDSLREQTHDEN